jgi:signal peptidase II
MRTALKVILGIAATVGVAALVALDQWTKALAEAALKGRGVVRLVGDFAVLIFTRNKGAFLSLGSGLPPTIRYILLIVVPIATLAFLGWAFLSRSVGRGKGAGGSLVEDFAAIALIVAGGAGNLIDRLLFGEVRDFLNFGIGRLRTGIMNLADLYILAALIVMVVTIASRGPRTRREAREGAAPRSDGKSS